MKIGYLTKFEASFSPETDEAVEYIEKFQCSDNFEEKLFYQAWVDSTDKTKWYSYEKFMKTLSKKFPNIVFQLDGIGEEFDDIWKSYFKAGKVQKIKAILTFDDYDPDKLV